MALASRYFIVFFGYDISFIFYPHSSILIKLRERFCGPLVDGKRKLCPENNKQARTCHKSVIITASLIIEQFQLNDAKTLHFIVI